MRTFPVTAVAVLSLGFMTQLCLTAQALTVQETSNAGETLPRNIPNRVGQIVLVTTPSWSSPTGLLRRLERRGGQWAPIGHAVPVMAGANGLAWGRGIHVPVQNGRQKIEGDRCAPAGIFQIGNAFGYSRSPGFSVRMPYKWITDRDYYIDDPESDDYNKWITIDFDKPNEPNARWKSFEVMKRPDSLYELGLVIRQNINPTVKNRGSAIFFHIWAGPGLPTSGCTSMARPDLVELLGWLDPGRSPVVIQASSGQTGGLTFRATK